MSTSPSPAWTARPSGALSGQPSAPSVSVPCPLSLRRRTRHWQYYRASLHLAAIQTRAWCLHDLFSVLSAPVCLSACFRKTLYLRTAVVIQLHRHQLGCSHHDGDRTFYFFKYQLHTSYILILRSLASSDFINIYLDIRIFQYVFIIINHCQKNLQCTLSQLA